ncbi:MULTISPECIES: HD-GYP domain-containing protein [Giesbergeria]|uniref:HD-GYP domain-containing protein n=1 Tax=Giesbergeria sinuosa TaxID=80883 RepID=A0ABV9QF24_9BURK
MEAELHHIIYALSDALDLVGVDDVAHGKRVGVMASACAEVLGWEPAVCDFMFELGMLHDIGVSSTRTHQHLVAEFDWVGSQEHAILGHDLLVDFVPLAKMALPIRYHHTLWAKLQTLALAPEIALQANLVYLTDRVDTLAAPYYASHAVLFHADGIRAEIARRVDSHFAPELVRAFMEISHTEAFWLRLEPRAVDQCLQQQLAHAQPIPAHGPEIRQVADLFARIVDAKSPFTARHSHGVARLSRLLAQCMGVSAEQCDKIEVAGLLHDLGKLRVPDEILEKPGALDAYERQVIHTHSFETFQILRSILGFEEVALWAAYHHEEPGGSGYPFHVDAQVLPLEARILRVADIFQAMVQDRPYRAGLTGPEAMVFMRTLQTEGRIEGQILDVLESHLDEAMSAAHA